MVDVILINPPVDGGVGGEALPLGLACIGEVLDSSGISVRCIDMCCKDESVEDVARIVSREAPVAVGVSVLSAALPHVLEIIKVLRRQGETNIVVGGTHITHDPGVVFSLDADYGLLGEGDYSFQRLVELLVKKQELGSMNGLVCLKDGEEIIGEKQTLIARDIPTPKRELFKNKYAHTPLNISRGCPHTCSYCAISCSKFRLRPLEDVIQELKRFVGKQIDFIDDVFTQDREYVEKLINIMIKEKIKVRWACTTRADLIDRKLLKNMKKSGLWYMSIGVETGSEERRREIGKDISDEIIIKTFKTCKGEGIKTRAYGMLGFPGETVED
ncbi:MAG: radical SAM protein, partial [Candidatus Altiarchaeota archaeon]